MANEETTVVENVETTTAPAVEATTTATTTTTETNSQPLTEGTPTTHIPPDMEADEFDVNFDKVTAPPSGKKKIASTSLKELDDDIWDGEEDIEIEENYGTILEKVLSRAKDYKTKANQYKTVAEATEVVKNDPQVKQLINSYGLSDEDLITNVRAAKYRKSGIGEEEALLKAQEYLDELPESIRKQTAEDIRLDIRAAINSRSEQIQSQIAETSKALSLSSAPNPELVSKAVEKLSKVDSFLGLKIGGKTETGRKDFLKPVEKAIKDGTLLKELQSNPELLTEVGLYWKYRDQFKAAIENRNPSRKQAAEALENAPHSNGVKAALRETPIANKDGGLKNPSTFK